MSGLEAGDFIANSADRLAYVMVSAGVDTSALRKEKTEEIRASVFAKVNEHLTETGQGADGRLAAQVTAATMRRLRTYLTGGSPWDVCPIGRAGLALAGQDGLPEQRALLESIRKGLQDRGFSPWVVSAWLDEIVAYCNRLVAEQKRQAKARQRQQAKAAFRPRRRA